MPRKTKETISKENKEILDKKIKSIDDTIIDSLVKPKKAVSKTASKAKKSAVSKTRKTKSSKKINLSKEDFSPEYYDLPYRYNQTIVRLLAQTPNTLFVYWDISDEDRNNLKTTFGEFFFEITKPVLIVHNETMKYSFEIDINDFANSWYIHVNDSDCQYSIELGRRPIPINYGYIPQYDVVKNGPIESVHQDYIFITSSNELIKPNDKILFNLSNPVLFRNAKTGKIIKRDFNEFPFVYNGELVDSYKLYGNLYNKNVFDDLLKNPSSGGMSSSLSSWSK